MLFGLTSHRTKTTVSMTTSTTALGTHFGDRFVDPAVDLVFGIAALDRLLADRSEMFVAALEDVEWLVVSELISMRF